MYKIYSLGYISGEADRSICIRGLARGCLYLFIYFMGTPILKAFLMKKCKRCLEFREESLFYKFRRFICKICLRKQAHAWQYEQRKIKDSSEWCRVRFFSIKYRARRKGLIFELTTKDFFTIYKNKKCFYCKELPKIKSIDRINNLLGYFKENCVMACLKCNTLKSNILISDKKRLMRILKKM